MSITSMTNVAFQRRTDTPGAPPLTSTAIAAATASKPESESAVTTSMKVIATYIPTEVLTLYLAVVAATTGGDTGWIAFGIFLVLTPTVVWLVYATRVKTSERRLPLNPSQWPMWEMFAATVAYAAWAFALPATPFASFPWYSASIAGIAVLATSMLLGLLAPLLMRPIQAGEDLSNPGPDSEPVPTA